MLSDLRFGVNLPPLSLFLHCYFPHLSCFAAEMVLLFVFAASFCLVSHTCNCPCTEYTAMILSCFLKAQLFKSCARATPSSCLHISIYTVYRLVLSASVSKAEIPFLLLLRGPAASWDHLSYWSSEPFPNNCARILPTQRLKR